MSHQVHCPILLRTHILPSLPFVAYIFLETFLVCDTPGNIQLQLISNFPKLISTGTLSKVSTLLPGDLFLLPLPVCFLSVFVIDLVYLSHSCRTSHSFTWLPFPWNDLILLGSGDPQTVTTSFDPVHLSALPSMTSSLCSLWSSHSPQVPSRAPLLLGSSMAWVRELPYVPSRDLLDGVCPAVLSLLQILE